MDPAAQQLLSEARIHFGDGGILQTTDDQLLVGDDGNPIIAGANKSQASPSKHNSIVNSGLVAARLMDQGH